MQSDHRPLEAIFRKYYHAKTTENAPTFTALQVDCLPGEQMFVADTLSRAYLPFQASADEHELAEDIDMLMQSLLSDDPASINKMEQLREETAQDPELSQLMMCLRNGFATSNTTRSLLRSCTSSMVCFSCIVDSLYRCRTCILQLVQ